MTQHAPVGRAAPTWRLPTYLLMILVVLAGSGYVVVDKLTSAIVVQTERADSPGAQPGFIPTASTDVVPQRPVHMVGHVVTGDALGLYGGTGTSACDVSMIRAFLATNPQPAQAWAGALRISTGDIDRYLDSLTALTLRTDTAVTNHGYRDGVATPFPSVLQAGTAVLVDAEGLPRVRCFCGNPLQTPVPMENIRYEGEPWTGFEPESVTVIGRAPREVREFVVLDHDSDQVVARPRATKGESDESVPPEVSALALDRFEVNGADGDGETEAGNDPPAGGADPPAPGNEPPGGQNNYNFEDPGAVPGNPGAVPDNPGAVPDNPGVIADNPGAVPGNPGAIPGPLPGNPGAPPGPVVDNPGAANPGPDTPANPPPEDQQPPGPGATDPEPDETDGDNGGDEGDGNGDDEGDGNGDGSGDGGDGGGEGGGDGGGDNGGDGGGD